MPAGGTAAFPALQLPTFAAILSLAAHSGPQVWT